MNILAHQKVLIKESPSTQTHSQIWLSLSLLKTLESFSMLLGYRTHILKWFDCRAIIEIIAQQGTFEVESRCYRLNWDECHFLIRPVLIWTHLLPSRPGTLTPAMLQPLSTHRFLCTEHTSPPPLPSQVLHFGLFCQMSFGSEFTSQHLTCFITSKMHIPPHTIFTSEIKIGLTVPTLSHFSWWHIN